MQAPTSRVARRCVAKNAERLRSHVLGVPRRSVRVLATTKASAQQIVSCLEVQAFVATSDSGYVV